VSSEAQPAPLESRVTPWLRKWARGALVFVTWLAVLWTIYEEQRHLMLYLGDPEIAFGLAEYVDIAATATLLLFAVYQVLHFVNATRAIDHYLADHPVIDTLTLWLALALGWGIYRDLSHFQHLYLGAEGALPFGDDFDEIAAALMALGVLKTCYHVWHAIRAVGRLRR
jgi:hypothetical protein